MDKVGNERESAIGMPMTILCLLAFLFGMIFIHMPRLLYRSAKKGCIRKISTSNELKLLERLEEDVSKYNVHSISSPCTPYMMKDGCLVNTMETGFALLKARDESLALCKEAGIANWKIKTFQKSTY